MRPSAVVFALLLSVVSALPAFAETFKTPKALLKALYAYDTDNTESTGPSPYSDYFSDHLNALFQADQDNTPDGDVGALDFDPVISGQDGKPSHVQVGQPVIIDNGAEVEVTFRNGDPVTLYYTLVREHGGWKVDDIANQQGEYPWSLSAIFGGQ